MPRSYSDPYDPIGRKAPSTMKNFGFCFRPRLGRGDCSGYLSLWIAFDDDHVAFLPTRYEVEACEWDALSGTVVVPECDSPRRRVLERYAASMPSDLHRIETLLSGLGPHGLIFPSRYFSAVR